MGIRNNCRLKERLKNWKQNFGKFSCVNETLRGVKGFPKRVLERQVVRMGCLVWLSRSQSWFQERILGYMLGVYALMDALNRLQKLQQQN